MGLNNRSRRYEHAILPDLEQIEESMETKPEKASTPKPVIKTQQVKPKEPNQPKNPKNAGRKPEIPGGFKREAFSVDQDTLDFISKSIKESKKVEGIGALMKSEAIRETCSFMLENWDEFKDKFFEHVKKRESVKLEEKKQRILEKHGLA